MRPLRGVVLRGGSILSVRIESGLIINCENRKKMECGDVVSVYFDFTKHEVRDIELALEERAADDNEIILEAREDNAF